MSDDKKEQAAKAAPLDQWVETLDFRSTEEIEIPDRMSDRVIGQDRAVEVIKKAAEQKRHVMLIGEPGTGKSMLANSMVEYLPRDELEDIIAYHNPEDFNEPRIRVLPAGKGKAIVAEQKAMAAAQRNQKNNTMLYLGIGIVGLALIYFLFTGNSTLLWLSVMIAFMLFILNRSPGPQKEVMIVPKLLVGHDPNDMPPFVDATGTHAGALLGDVRHDPFQSGGLETPSHDRLESGCIHRANKGVLFIDEINLLRMESQQALLTAMQEKKLCITGQSERSSGALVKSEPVPTDFVLVCAGNMDALEGMHPALRSRIRGYGYEVYMRNTMDDTDEHRHDVIRFVAQEVRKDGKIPHFDKYAACEIIREAQRRSGTQEKLTLRFRELGGLVRVSGDLAKEAGKSVVGIEDVINARKIARSLEQQISDRVVEGHKLYESFRTSGDAIGAINGLAALNGGSNMAEYSGIVLPIVAEVTPSPQKKGGIVATGKLGEIAKEAIENIASVIKKFAVSDLAEKDIHVQFIGTYDGVEGDSASVTITTAIISALEQIPIDQTLAMTGSLNVRGQVLPVGGITAKLEAAAESGLVRAVIPKSNRRDIMIESRYHETMEIYLAETIRDVFEFAFVDCPKKQEYMDKLAVLNPNGSTLERFVPPKERALSAVAEEDTASETVIEMPAAKEQPAEATRAVAQATPKAITETVIEMPAAKEQPAAEQAPADPPADGKQ